MAAVPRSCTILIVDRSRAETETGLITLVDGRSLRPDEELELVGSVPNWHEVRRSGESDRFVSKRWARVIPTVIGPVTPSVVAHAFTMDVIDVGTGFGVQVAWVGLPIHCLCTLPKQTRR